MFSLRFLARWVARRQNKPPLGTSTPGSRLKLEFLEERWLPSLTTGAVGVASPTFFPTYEVLQQTGTNPQDGSGTLPAGYSPAQIRHAYGLDTVHFPGSSQSGAADGSGSTIAIVDAFDDPSIADDLATFDQTFGLPAPPSFTKVGIDANGHASTTSFPDPDPGWASEIELDVEWVHAIAPGAKILLVEANGADLTDLMNAVDYARNYSGVVAVSMSWGTQEFSDETKSDSHFTTPTGHGGVTFLASSGDSGAPILWPAVSSNVVGTGGTTLNLDSNGNYLSETGWSGSGGSISQYETQPSYQRNLAIFSGDPPANGMRAGPDVAAVADPNTGLAVYGTYGFGGWISVGGTSAAAPQWAGLLAVASQGRALNGLGPLGSSSQTLAALYQAPSSDFHDITSGDNGYPAGAGFDLVTGRGSPVATQLLPDLGAPLVKPILTSVLITPANPTIGDGGQGQLGATGLDQFGHPMGVQQFSWSLLSGQGTIDSTGLYTAPAGGTGTATVQVTASANGVTVSTTTTVNYLPGPAISGLSSSASTVTGTTTTLTAQLSDPNVGSLNWTWSVVSEPAGAAGPTWLPPSGSLSGSGPISTTVTFSQAGDYTFQLSVTDAPGVSASSTVTVTVGQTLTTVQVTPASSALGDGAQQQFTAVAEDQFGFPLTVQPAFTWALGNDSLGAIDGTGLFTAPSTGVGTESVSATTRINDLTITGSATVSWSPGLSIVSLTASPSPVSGSTTTLTAQVVEPDSNASVSYNWTPILVPNGVSQPSLDNPNGLLNGSALTTKVSFAGPGTYQFQLTVSDDLNRTATSTVTVTVVAQPVSITGLKANPSPVTAGNKTILSAQVSDSNPNANFQWTTESWPAGVAVPSLDTVVGPLDGNTLRSQATFYGPGTYVFGLTVWDSWGQSLSKNVSVTVVANPITISPVTANPSMVVAANTTSLSAQVTDPNPALANYVWILVSQPTGVAPANLDNPNNALTGSTVSTHVVFSGPGTYQLQLLVWDSWGQSSTSNLVTVTVVAQPITLTPLAANPNPVSGPTTTLSSQVADPNPANTHYAWDLLSWPAAVALPNLANPDGVLTSSSATLTANPTFYGPGTYQYQLTVWDDWGETSSSTVKVTVTAQPPTITSLTADASSVTGTTTTLRAQVTAPALASVSYNWSVLQAPSSVAPPTLGNTGGTGASAAMSNPVTFYGPGTYQFQLKLTDAWGQSTSQTVKVTVAPTLTSVTVTPTAATMLDGTTQQIKAAAYDQFHHLLSPQPAFTWSVASGPGSISSSGLYKAPPSGSGTALIQAAATVNGVTVPGTVPVTLAAALPPVISQISATPTQANGKTYTLKVLASNPAGGALTYAWSVLSLPSGARAPAFGSKGSSSSGVTFYQAGTYIFQVQVTNRSGLSTTATVSVTINPILASIAVTPNSVTVKHGTTQQFIVIAYDQFHNPLADPPLITWSLSGLGTIDSNGLYTAPGSFGRAFARTTIKVTARGDGVTISATAAVLNT